MGTVFTHLSLPVDSPDPSVIMANYDRRTATGQAGDRFNRPGVDRYGRAMSLGRWESDRSIEDRYGRGYEGDPLAISAFFRYGRERYSRAYDKVEPYRRTAQHRSQSLARLDSQRAGGERFDAEHRHRDTQRAAGAERFETEHRDRYAKENQRFDTSEGKDQRYGKDNRYNRQ